MQDKISVIVPVYNVEKYLDRCVKSIINQTYEMLEIILVDDGSSDNCPLLCDEWAKKDNRIVVIHKENGGVSSARNVGLGIATGKYIGFVDSDDWIDSNMYYNLGLNILKTNADIVLCDYFNVSDNQLSFCNKPLAPGLYEGNELFQIVNNMFGGGGYFGSVCRGLFKKDIIDKFKLGFSDRRFAEDLMFCLEYLLKCKNACLIEDNLYYYFNNQLSTVHILGERDIPNFLSIPTHIYNILKNNKVNNEISFKKIGNEQVLAIWRTFWHTDNYQQFNNYLKSFSIFYGFDLYLLKYFTLKHKIIYLLLKLKFNKIIFYYFFKAYHQSKFESL